MNSLTPSNEDVALVKKVRDLSDADKARVVKFIGYIQSLTKEEMNSYIELSSTTGFDQKSFKRTTSRLGYFPKA
jgi:hypothetical protein